MSSGCATMARGGKARVRGGLAKGSGCAAKASGGVTIKKGSDAGRSGGIAKANGGATISRGSETIYSQLKTEAEFLNQQLKNMNKKDEARLGMVDTVIAFLNADTATVALVPAFDALFTVLKNKRTALGPYLATAALPTKGKTVAKASIRSLLCTTASDMAKIVKSYAVSVADADLQAIMDYSYSDLFRLKDEELVPACENIHDGTNDHLAALVPYNVTAGMLTNLNTLITNFENANPGTRNAVINRSVAIQNSKDGIKEMVSILKDQMDGVAVQFKAANADFYDGYVQARVIVDNATDSEEEETPPPTPPNP